MRNACAVDITREGYMQMCQRRDMPASRQTCWRMLMQRLSAIDVDDAAMRLFAITVLAQCSSSYAHGENGVSASFLSRRKDAIVP